MNLIFNKQYETIKLFLVTVLQSVNHDCMLSFIPYLKTYVGVSSLKFEIIKYICDGCVNYDEIATHLVDQYHIENQEAFIKEYYSHCLISLAKQKILEEDPVNEYIGHLK